MNYYGSHQEEFAMYAGPQHWNDPDMVIARNPPEPQLSTATVADNGSLPPQLVIGNYGLSYDQAKAQMAVWAVLAAPLIMSHDLRKVKDEFRSILLNPFVIRVNQDPMGIQGKRIFMVIRCLFFKHP